MECGFRGLEKEEGPGGGWRRGCSGQDSVVEFKEKSSFQRGGRPWSGAKQRLRRTTEERPESLIRKWGGWGQEGRLSQMLRH